MARDARSRTRRDVDARLTHAGSRHRRHRAAPIYVVAGAVGIHRAWRRSGVDAATVAAVRRQRLHVLADPRGLPRRASASAACVGVALARRTTDPRGGARRRASSLLVLAIAFGALGDRRRAAALAADGARFCRRFASSPALTFAFDALRCAFALLPATILWGASFPLALAAAGRRRDPGGTSRASTPPTPPARSPARSRFTLIGIPLLGSQRAQQALVVLAALSGLRCSAVAIAATPASPSAAAVAVASLRCALLDRAAGARPSDRLRPLGRIRGTRSSSSSISRKAPPRRSPSPKASPARASSTSPARSKPPTWTSTCASSACSATFRRCCIPNPRSILIVGVGAGVTAGALSVHPEVERIVICEIEPVVPASARAYFGEENHHVFDDPRVELVFDDARHFLQTTKETFDIITSDPIHPWVRGAATLYSLEYLQLARST